MVDRQSDELQVVEQEDNNATQIRPLKRRHDSQEISNINNARELDDEAEPLPKRVRFYNTCVSLWRSIYNFFNLMSD